MPLCESQNFSRPISPLLSNIPDISLSSCEWLWRVWSFRYRAKRSCHLQDFWWRQNNSVSTGWLSSVLWEASSDRWYPMLSDIMEVNRLSEDSENIFFWMKKNWKLQSIFSRKDDISLSLSVDLSQLSGILSLSLREWEKWIWLNSWSTRPSVRGSEIPFSRSSENIWKIIGNWWWNIAVL